MEIEVQRTIDLHNTGGNVEDKLLPSVNINQHNKATLHYKIQCQLTQALQNKIYRILR